MRKKRMHDQEEVKQKNINKTTENKENTNIPDIQPSGDLKNPAPEGETGAGASDKVVPEEMPAEEKLAELQD